MSGTLRLSEIKIESFDPNLSKSEMSSSIISDAFETKLDDSVRHLKREVLEQFTECQQKFELEAQQRLVLEAALRKEVENRRILEEQNKKLSEQAISLTQRNEILSKENFGFMEELQQSHQFIRRLHDELNLKAMQVTDLSSKWEKLSKEKASFNKNFKDRLKNYIDDMSISDSDNVDMESDCDFPEKCGQTNNTKRPYVSDLEESSIHDESNATLKRSKMISLSSSDPNVDSTGYVQANESTVVDEPVLNDRGAQESSEPVHESDTVAGIEQSDDNAGPDLDGDANNDCLDVALYENLIVKIHRRSADNDDRAVMLYENPIPEKRRNFRRNIQKVMDFENLTPETKDAFQKEKKRRKQYARRLQEYSETYGRLPGELNNLDQILLDFDLNTRAELLAVDRRLSIKLKPHQCEGVKFMWDACFESIERLQRSKGGGCILSHCMGLGKTLQVITLVHTLLTHSAKTKVSKVLVICPVNAILNWVDEFKIWLKPFPEHESINVLELTTGSSPNERRDRLEYWHENGGVVIVGYKMFQIMYQKMERQTSSTTDSSNLYHALIDPGADLVVCDEGHLLKNSTSQLSLAINKIRTSRRIVLTGTPLQNNLKEYFSMIEFVKPRLLGTEKEFNNRFVGPIMNGQYVDSTEDDITLMKHRAFILHKLLEGCVHRRDYSVLAQFLPPKQEYALFIRLTEKQMDLYKFYMVNFVVSKPIIDLPPLRRICNHPMVLTDFKDRNKSKQSTTQENDDADSELGVKLLDKNDDWWKGICSGDQIEMSNKMLILSAILSECEARNEKLVVFSGCLSTLNVIEHFLANISETTRRSKASLTDYRGIWKRDVDYSRLDGAQTAEKRRIDVARFNRETNTRTRLFLISTKAGSLGINLMAANRVIIFDASWNPSDDIQSIFRIYRIGQSKICYIYRFVALGTMEEKIYDRQVSKLSLAKRVIDEHEIGRHFKEEDLQQLYCIDSLDPPTKQHAHTKTEDSLLDSVLQKYEDIVFKHHDHDSLLENVVEETLTGEDVCDVWEIFD